MILFLDFDGVLHSTYQPDDDPERVFTHVPLLAAWLEAWPGVDVVISSSWRLGHSQQTMVALLGSVIGSRVLGCTPWADQVRDDNVYPSAKLYELIHERQIQNFGSCLPDSLFRITVDRPRARVTIASDAFDSHLVGWLVTQLLPEDHGIRAYRADDAGWHPPTPPYELRLRIGGESGVEFVAEVVRLSSAVGGGVAVRLNRSVQLMAVHSDFDLKRNGTEIPGQDGQGLDEVFRSLAIADAEDAVAEMPAAAQTSARPNSGISVAEFFNQLADGASLEQILEICPQISRKRASDVLREAAIRFPSNASLLATTEASTPWHRQK